MPILALPGPVEAWVIGGLLILVFGAKKLPELARAMGSSVTQFKKGLKDETELLEEADSAAAGASGATPETKDA